MKVVRSLLLVCIIFLPLVVNTGSVVILDSTRINGNGCVEIDGHFRNDTAYVLGTVVIMANLLDKNGSVLAEQKLDFIYTGVPDIDPGAVMKFVFYISINNPSNVASYEVWIKDWFMY